MKNLKSESETDNIHMLLQNQDEVDEVSSLMMWDEVKSFESIRDADGNFLFTVITLNSQDTEDNDYIFILDHEAKRLYQATTSEWQELIRRSKPNSAA